MYKKLDSITPGSSGHSQYKTGPSSRPDGFYGKATTPTVSTIHERPNYVIINTTGSYSFCYDLTGSVGTSYAPTEGAASGNEYVDAITIRNLNQGPTRLDIQPQAWSGSFPSGVTPAGASGPTTGDVTFVYIGSK